MFNKKINLLLITSFLGFLFPLVVHAHGSAITQQQIIGDRIVEFEYDGSGKIFAGDLVLYTFDLLNKVDDSRVLYDRVLVRMSRDGANSPLFATTVAPTNVLGRTASRAHVVINEAGTYVVDLSFYSGDNVLSKSNFTFTVDNPTQTKSIRSGFLISSWVYMVIIGFLSVTIVVLIVRIRKIAALHR